VDVGRLGAQHVLRGRDVDANAMRERARQRRLLRLCIGLGLLATWLWFRALSGDPVGWGVPHLFADRPDLLVSFGLTALLGLIIAVPLLAAGRSPHVLLRPADTGVRLADVVGAEATKREAIDSLNLFLAHKTFSDEMGGQPRRGVLFEGPPGTGKTHLAKAMSGEAGVPFLFVSASAFQSMYYGQTNRKIRSYFKALRKAAAREGGAIGFIEEFDAIGAARSSMGSGGTREGVTGVVNELLVQMQSFDLPSGSRRFVARLVDVVNLALPPEHHLPRPVARPANVLLVAATNRAADLDPALLRPGRFDRLVHFGLPARASRAAIADHYLARKRHGADLSGELVAGVTAGYSPAAIERLLDEALVCALRQDRHEMVWTDVLEAKLVTELGLAGDAVALPDERRRIAVHEAGHALIAERVGRHVTIASILQRSEALGLVAHTDREERNLHTPTEARAALRIMLAGRAAEELEFGEASSGVAADLEAATGLAARLVGSLGAAGSLVSFDAAAMAVAGNLVAKVLADEPARAALEAALNAAAAEAQAMLATEPGTLRALADALVQRDELTGDEVRAVIGRAPVPDGAPCPP